MTRVPSLLLSERDSVVVLLADACRGDLVENAADQPVSARTDVPAGHKLAIRSVGPGEIVLKYGEAIGLASRAIVAGDHVHTHNVHSARAGGSHNR